MNQPLVHSSLPVSSRVVLMAGFGGLLLLMAFAGIRRHPGAAADPESQRHHPRGLPAAHARAGAHPRRPLRFRHVRPRLPAGARERARPKATGYSLLETRRDMDAALAEYRALLDARETAPFEVLTRELDEYWGVLEPVLHWTPAQRQQAGYAFLRDEVFPAPPGPCWRIADQIGAINEPQLNAGKPQGRAGPSCNRAGGCAHHRADHRAGPAAGRLQHAQDPGAGGGNRRALPGDRSARARSCSSSRRGWWRRRRTSAAPFRASCTTKWASR